MVLHVVRLIFVLLVLAITVSFAFQEAIYTGGTKFITIYILTPAVLALAAVFIDMFWRRKKLQELSGLELSLPVLRIQRAKRLNYQATLNPFNLM